MTELLLLIVDGGEGGRREEREGKGVTRRRGGEEGGKGGKRSHNLLESAIDAVPFCPSALYVAQGVASRRPPAWSGS